MLKKLNVVRKDGEDNTDAPEVPAFLVRKTPFAKQLRWHIENPKQEPVRWTVTPQMAQTMLAWNDRNRPITPAKAKEYAASMAAGRWHYTGVPIIFSPSRLIDGQHRLVAAIESNTAIDVLVVFGAPDDAFPYIDVGKTRTASDIFSINGVKGAALIAAAMQWIVGYERGTTKTASTRHLSLDHAELYREYEKHADIQEATWVAGLFARNKLTSPSMMLGLFYICSKKNKAAAEQFFRKVGDGIGFSGKKDPAYRLHKKLIDNAISPEKLGRTAIAAITIKAWNASRLNRDCGALTFSVDETFPKVI